MFDLNHPLLLAPKTLREFFIINHFFLTNTESFSKKYPSFFNGPPVDLTAKVPTPSWWPFLHLRHLPHLGAPAATDKETLNEATDCNQGFARLAGDSCVPRCQLESQVGGILLVSNQRFFSLSVLHCHTARYSSTVFWRQSHFSL
jgi:hypothetical protein